MALVGPSFDERQWIQVRDWMELNLDLIKQWGFHVAFQVATKSDFPKYIESMGWKKYPRRFRRPRWWQLRDVALSFNLIDRDTAKELETKAVRLRRPTKKDPRQVIPIPAVKLEEAA